MRGAAMRALGLCVVLATAATVSAVPQETATKCSDRCKEQKVSPPHEIRDAVLLNGYSSKINDYKTALTLLDIIFFSF